MRALAKDPCLAARLFLKARLQLGERDQFVALPRGLPESTACRSGRRSRKHESRVFDGRFSGIQRGKPLTLPESTTSTYPFVRVFGNALGPAEGVAVLSGRIRAGGRPGRSCFRERSTSHLKFGCSPGSSSMIRLRNGPKRAIFRCHNPRKRENGRGERKAWPVRPIFQDRMAGFWGKRALIASNWGPTLTNSGPSQRAGVLLGA